MTWLITGAAGQLGSAMRSDLDSRGLPYVAMNSGELDITDPKSVEHAVRSCQPTVIINCAAWTDVDGAEINITKAQNINAIGPKNLALASKRVGAKFVQISTDYVFSGTSAKPWQENAERNPISAYGQTKRDGEDHVQIAYPDGSYIVRTAWLYSALGKNFAKTILSAAILSEDEIRVVSDQSGQPTSANDLAKQISNLVLSNAPCGIYHGTNSGQTTWFEFAQKIFLFANANPTRVVPISSSELSRRAKRPQYSVLGHDSWQFTGLAAMRNWEIALGDELTTMILKLKQESSK